MIGKLQNYRRLQRLLDRLEPDEAIAAKEHSALAVGKLTTFLAGGLIGSVTSLVLSQIITFQGDGSPFFWLQIIIGIIMCGLLYMVVTYLDLVVDGIKRARNYRFFVHADANVNGQIKKGAFAFCTRVAASAERRIVVMGPYFDQDEKDSSHDFYLDEGIMGAVNRHLQMGSQDFEYQRIVQMDQDVYESCRDEREFFAGALNNIGLAKHVAEVLDLASSHPTQGPKIEIFARPHVASFPSMLLVDDRFVFFSLPTELTRSGSRRTYDLVLGFEDVSGAMPKLLRSVVRKFAETDSTRIYNILPDQ